VIGPDSCLNEGVSIEACELVRLGSRVHLGPWSKILDNHFHSLQGDHRGLPPSQPVIIEDDVHIGARAIVLPGAYIQKGAIVREGAVVTRRVAAGSEVAGNPAKPV
jgi:acetyltransferase-like isoleucine patch superfamily enzyme